MNNAEFRDQIAKKMIALRKAKNLALDEIDNLDGVNDSIIRSASNSILENFYNGIDMLKNIPGYKEAEETHNAKKQAIINEKKLQKEKERIEKALIDADLQIKYSDLVHIGKERLIGNVDAVLDDIKNHHVTINDVNIPGRHFDDVNISGRYFDDEMRMHNGKRIDINLPRVGKFGGYKKTFSVTNKGDDYRYVKQDITSYDIWDLLDALRKYLFQFGIEVDKELLGIYAGKENPYKEYRSLHPYDLSDTTGIKYLSQITGIDYEEYKDLIKKYNYHPGYVGYGGY